MKKAIIYGLGQFLNEHQEYIPSDIDVVGFGDKSVARVTSQTNQRFTLNGSIQDKVVYHLSELKEVDFDLIYIATDWLNAGQILTDLVRVGVPGSKIRFLFREEFKDRWKYEIDDDRIHDTIFVKNNEIRIDESLDSSTDFNIISETFYCNQYGIDIHYDNTVVIDMGMNIGDATLYFAADDNVQMVYGYEPFPDTFRRAQENIRKNSQEIINKINCNSVALSDHNGNELIESRHNDGTGFRSILDKSQNEEGVTITCKAADDELGGILRRHHGSHFIIKCDVEGSEHQIFPCLAKSGILKQIDVIVMEYHQGREDLLKLFREAGFQSIFTGNVRIGMIYAVRNF